MGRGEHGEDGREVDITKEEVEREEAQGDQVLAEEKLSIVLGHTVLYDLRKIEEAQGDQVLRGKWQFSGQFGFRSNSLPGMDPILQYT